MNNNSTLSSKRTAFEGVSRLSSRISRRRAGREVVGRWRGEETSNRQRCCNTHPPRPDALLMTPVRVALRPHTHTPTQPTPILRRHNLIRSRPYIRRTDGRMDERTDGRTQYLGGRRRLDRRSETVTGRPSTGCDCARRCIMHRRRRSHGRTHACLR